MSAVGFFRPISSPNTAADMKRALLCWTGLILVGACGPTLPPAPTLAPVALHDTLVPSIDSMPAPEAVTAADAEVLDGLASSGPDERTVPAFDGSSVRWDIDVRSYAGHPRVQYYLRYFQSSARSRMDVFLERGARYEPIIRERFEAEGLPGDLGYLALIESGYSSEAVSRSYAVGMWQFMRGTGQGYGLRVDTWVDERRDPMKATAAAARHLRDLRRRFGSLYLAAAAYNAGAGKVSRSLGKLTWDTLAVAEDSAEVMADAEAAEEVVAEPAAEVMAATSDAAFFRLAGTDLLAAETQDYVPKLIAAAIVAKQPERFGFAAPTSERFAYDSIVVTETTGLDVIAGLADATVDDIRQLNLQYLRLATPPRSTATIRLPVGTGETVARRYAELPASKRVRFLTHEVRRRETLSTVAARFRVPASDIRAANPKKVRGTRLKAGTRLVIPTAAIPSALAMRAVGAPAGHRAALAARTHRVRRGETLSGIAVRYRVSLRALRRVNAIRNDDYLRAGMRLRIPG